MLHILTTTRRSKAELLKPKLKEKLSDKSIPLSETPETAYNFFYPYLIK